MDRVFDIFARDRLVRKIDRAAGEMRLRLTAQIQNDLNKVFEVRLSYQGLFEVWRHDAEQEIEIICDFLAWQFRCSSFRVDLLPYDHAR